MKIVLEVMKTVWNVYFPNGGVSMQFKQMMLLYSVIYHWQAQAFVQNCWWHNTLQWYQWLPRSLTWNSTIHKIWGFRRHGFVLLTSLPWHIAVWKAVTKHWVITCDFRLQPWCKWDLRSSGMLHTVHWHLFTDVSGQPIGSFFKDQTVPKRR